MPEVLKISRRKIVRRAHMRDARIRKEALNKVAADESSRAGDKCSHAKLSQNLRVHFPASPCLHRFACAVRLPNYTHEPAPAFVSFFDAAHKQAPKIMTTPDK